LQQLAKYIRRPDLADRAMWVLKWAIIGGILLVALAVGTAVGVAIVGPGATLGAGGFLIFGEFLFFVFIRFAQLTFGDEEGPVRPRRFARGVWGRPGPGRDARLMLVRGDRATRNRHLMHEPSSSGRRGPDSRSRITFCQCH